jgi:hypothetical protein
MRVIITVFLKELNYKVGPAEVLYTSEAIERTCAPATFGSIKAAGGCLNAAGPDGSEEGYRGVPLPGSVIIPA